MTDKATAGERSHKNAAACKPTASGVVPPSSAPLPSGSDLEQLRLRHRQLIYGALFILQSQNSSTEETKMVVPNMRVGSEAEIERREGES